MESQIVWFCICRSLALITIELHPLFCMCGIWIMNTRYIQVRIWYSKQFDLLQPQIDHILSIWISNVIRIFVVCKFTTVKRIPCGKWNSSFQYLFIVWDNWAIWLMHSGLWCGRWNSHVMFSEIKLKWFKTLTDVKSRASLLLLAFRKHSVKTTIFSTAITIYLCCNCTS